MKLTAAVYQSLIKFYSILPLKREICLALRWVGLPKKFHRDLFFEEPFKVPIGNFHFKISQYTTVESIVFWQGVYSYEPDTLWLWELLAKEANVIFDIGANNGIYTLIARTLNPTCQIYSFEPVKRTFNIFQKNLRYNHYVVNIENIALSNTDGEQTFYDTDAVDQMSASLSPDKLKNLKSYTGNIVEYKVTTSKLDSYIKQNNIQNIDLMKIDVELHEPEVMEGFKNYLLQFKPDIIIEVLTQDVADKLNSILKDSDYLIYHLQSKNAIALCDKTTPVEDRWNFLLCKKETAQKLQPYIKI